MSKQVELDRACSDCWAQGAKHERQRIIQIIENAIIDSEGYCHADTVIAHIKAESK